MSEHGDFTPITVTGESIPMTKPIIKTVQLSPSISDQGVYVRTLPDGRIEIKDGDQPYIGKEVK